jgi:hypothetical protein
MSLSVSKWAAIVATALAGTVTGSLAFVSFVDVRSFVKHVSNPEGTEIARRHFQVWWPYGRDWMAPLIGSASIAHAVAWRMTKQASWAAAGLCVFLVGPYTALILGEDIERLRKSSGGEVKETTERFCRLHHVRLGVAGVGFFISLLGLAEL